MEEHLSSDRLRRVYNYFRNYDPTLGRYTQSDPIGLEGGIATYAYVGSAPLTFADSDGTSPAAAALAPLAPALPAAAGDAAILLGPPAAVLGSFLAGWQAGSAAYNGGLDIPLGNAIDACMSSKSREQKCTAAYDAQIQVCQATTFTKKARNQCYARATQIYGDCLAGRS